MPKKYVDSVALGQAITKIKQLLGDKVSVESGKGLSSNDFTTTEKQKLESLENYTLPTASNETKGGIIVGSGLSIENGVLSTVAGGVADSVNWSGVQGKPNSLAGYGITDAMTSTEVNSAISTAVSGLVTSEEISALEGRMTGVYHFKGSVANLAALEAITNPEEGDVYNISDTGINAAWVVDETAQNGGYWDQFGMTVDFDNIETMTTAEVDALFE